MRTTIGRWTTSRTTPTTRTMLDVMIVMGFQCVLRAGSRREGWSHGKTVVVDVATLVSGSTASTTGEPSFGNSSSGEGRRDVAPAIGSSRRRSGAGISVITSAGFSAGVTAEELPSNPLPSLSQVSNSCLYAKIAWPPGTRCTGRPRFSHRLTVFSARFRYFAISFHESSLSWGDGNSAISLSLLNYE